MVPAFCTIKNVLANPPGERTPDEESRLGIVRGYSKIQRSTKKGRLRAAFSALWEGTDCYGISSSMK